MAAMMRVTTNNVWIAVFKAEDHPQAVIALGLTGLTHGRVADLSEAYDYRIHADRGAVSKHYKIHFDRWSDDYDSVVQLFVDSPEEAKWIPALQTYLALGGKVSVGDWVRVISCENIEHRFIMDRKYIGRALEVVAVDDHPVFAFRVGIHYPYCLCGLAAWKRKT